MLQFFPHAEGYLKFTGNINSVNDEVVFIDYIYKYKDHLGNIRLNYLNEKGTLKILEENHYYPFGLKHTYNYSKMAPILEEFAGVMTKRIVQVSNSGYQYKYNGKEWQDELNLNLYDYGARNYDPALGRYFNVDKFSESYIDLNPYQYTANNPIKFIDVNGDYIYIYDGANCYRYINGGVQLYNSETSEWSDCEPEDNSYVSDILGFLNQISMNDENSFGSFFLNLFSNDKINAYISNWSRSERKKDKNYNSGLNVFTSFNQRDQIPTTGNFESVQKNFYITLGHELAHTLAKQLFSSGVLDATWIADVQTSDGFRSITNEEVYTTYIENLLRMEQGLELRTHYIGGSVDERSRLIKKSEVQNPFYKGTYEPTKATMQILKDIHSRPLLKVVSNLSKTSFAKH